MQLEQTEIHDVKSHMNKETTVAILDLNKEERDKNLLEKEKKISSSKCTSGKSMAITP